MDKISINIIDVDRKTHTLSIPVDLNLNLMDVLKDAGFEMGNCGGMALCASCHCEVNNNSRLNKITVEEGDMLDQLHNSDSNSRLICQIPLSKELDGIILKIIND